MSAPAPTGPFSRRALRWMVGICAASVAAAVALAAWGDPLAGHRSHRADSTSPSAIGHEAFRRLLEALGIPVVVSRTPATRLAARGGLLIVAEPLTAEGVAERCGRARTALLVLPKWDGPPHDDRADWLGHARPADPARVQALLAAVAPDAAAIGIDHGGTRWTGAPVTPALRPTQLTRGGALAPVVACAEGTLLGIASLPGHPDATCWVLADPDCLATHGLARGDNAAFAVWIVDRLRGDGPVVFDETVHGIQLDPSLVRELGTLPLALVPMHGLLCVAALAWLAMVRFGAPEPRPPAHAAGKRFLIAHTAALQRAGGQSGYVLLRYWQAAVRRVAEALHLPPGLPPAEVKDRLRRLAQARGVAADLEGFQAHADAAAAPRAPVRRPGDGTGRRRATSIAEILAAAQRIQRWQEAMRRGT